MLFRNSNKVLFNLLFKLDYIKSAYFPWSCFCFSYFAFLLRTHNILYYYVYGVLEYPFSYLYYFHIQKSYTKSIYIVESSTIFILWSLIFFSHFFFLISKIICIPLSIYSWKEDGNINSYKRNGKWKIIVRALGKIIKRE